jgi:hypothetical protein
MLTLVDYFSPADRSMGGRLTLVLVCWTGRRYQIFWEVVGLERGTLSLVSTIEELLGRKSSGSGLENQEYGRRDPPRWPRVTLYPQTLALTSPTRGGRSIGIVRSRTQATECFWLTLYSLWAQYSSRDPLWPLWRLIITLQMTDGAKEVGAVS